MADDNIFDCYKKLTSEIEEAKPYEYFVYETVKSSIGVNPEYAYNLTVEEIDKKMQRITKDIKSASEMLNGIPISSSDYLEVVMKLKALHIAYSFLLCIKRKKSR